MPTDQVIVELQVFSEVQVIFAIYLDICLKWKTRNDRTSGTQIQYKVDDSTIIKRLKTSDLVSHIPIFPILKPKTFLTKANISFVLS